MVQWSDGMCGAVMRRGWLWGWYSSGHSDPGSGAGIIITLTTHNHVSEITNRKPPALHSAQVWYCRDISEFLSSLCVVSLFEADFEFILSQINQTNNFVLIGNYWGWWPPVYSPPSAGPGCVTALLIVAASPAYRALIRFTPAELRTKSIQIWSFSLFWGFEASQREIYNN